MLRNKLKSKSFRSLFTGIPLLVNIGTLLYCLFAPNVNLVKEGKILIDLYLLSGMIFLVTIIILIYYSEDPKTDKNGAAKKD